MMVIFVLVRFMARTDARHQHCKEQRGEQRHGIRALPPRSGVARVAEALPATGGAVGDLGPGAHGHAELLAVCRAGALDRPAREVAVIVVRPGQVRGPVVNALYLQWSDACIN